MVHRIRSNFPLKICCQFCWNRGKLVSDRTWWQHFQHFQVLLVRSSPWHSWLPWPQARPARPQELVQQPRMPRYPQSVVTFSKEYILFKLVTSFDNSNRRFKSWKLMKKWEWVAKSAAARPLWIKVAFHCTSVFVECSPHRPQQGDSDCVLSEIACISHSFGWWSVMCFKAKYARSPLFRGYCWI